MPAMISNDAYPFLAFLGLTCLYEDIGIRVLSGFTILHVSKDTEL